MGLGGGQFSDRSWNASLNYLSGEHCIGTDGLEYVAVKPSGPKIGEIGPKIPGEDTEYWATTDRYTYLQQEIMRTKLPIGHMYLHIGSVVPTGTLVADGSEYSRASYPKLVEYVTQNNLLKTEEEWQLEAETNNGFCPYFSSGSSETLFRVPKFAPYIHISGSVENTREYLQPGLPNITGEIKLGSSYAPWTVVTTPGALSYTSVNGSFDNGTNTTGGLTNLQLDASRSNPIYGQSDTVQPESHKWVVLIVAD